MSNSLTIDDANNNRTLRAKERKFLPPCLERLGDIRGNRLEKARKHELARVQTKKGLESIVVTKRFFSLEMLTEQFVTLFIIHHIDFHPFIQQCVTRFIILSDR